MTPLALKWIFIILAFGFPIVYVMTFRSAWRQNRITGFKSRSLRIFYWPVTWVVGFIFLHQSLRFHQDHWMAINGGLPTTEDQMVAFGDNPNVTAAWVTTGTILIVAVYVFASILGSRKSIKPSDS